MQIDTDSSRSSITVPQSALLKDGQQNPFVWVLAEHADGKTVYTCVMHPEVRSDKPGKCPKCAMDLVPSKKGGKFVAHRVNVMTGGTDSGRIEIRSGLRPGDRVIVRGNENLNEDDPVTSARFDGDGLKELPESSSTEPLSGHAGMRM